MQNTVCEQKKCNRFCLNGGRDNFPRKAEAEFLKKGLFAKNEKTWNKIEFPIGYCGQKITSAMSLFKSIC